MIPNSLFADDFRVQQEDVFDAVFVKAYFRKSCLLACMRKEGGRLEGEEDLTTRAGTGSAMRM